MLGKLFGRKEKVDEPVADNFLEAVTRAIPRAMPIFQHVDASAYERNRAVAAARATMDVLADVLTPANGRSDRIATTAKIAIGNDAVWQDMMKAENQKSDGLKPLEAAKDSALEHADRTRAVADGSVGCRGEAVAIATACRAGAAFQEKSAIYVDAAADLHTASAMTYRHAAKLVYEQPGCGEIYDALTDASAKYVLLHDADRYMAVAYRAEAEVLREAAVHFERLVPEGAQATQKPTDRGAMPRDWPPKKAKSS